MWTSQMIVLFVLAGSSLSSFLSDTPSRNKRNSLQLCDIIQRNTRRNCLSYTFYGCFCGLRSWGSNPVDSSDSCCRQHDNCFSSIGRSGLPFLTYSYHCSGNFCQCTDSNRNSAQYRSCQCDVQLGRCLRNANYNILYNLYQRRRCR
ncbi:basic phospholipase A2 PA-12A-like [Biomphalaria glabrata]|uniref:Basic phospholipase A2 PA-12A-like n=1 Tax=Biomphalaria glabrata TaxID=6526 RepID=A0A9W3AYJ3_BIOGL|nr:basic phospholipase A2 PA-12A-like [Biomphalaria glabrata]